jgi:hypothetical protein
LKLTAQRTYFVYKKASDGKSATRFGFSPGSFRCASDWFEGCTTDYSSSGLFPIAYVQAVAIDAGRSSASASAVATVADVGAVAADSSTSEVRAATPTHTPPPPQQQQQQPQPQLNSSSSSTRPDDGTESDSSASVSATNSGRLPKTAPPSKPAVPSSKPPKPTSRPPEPTTPIESRRSSSGGGGTKTPEKDAVAKKASSRRKGDSAKGSDSPSPAERALVSPRGGASSPTPHKESSKRVIKLDKSLLGALELPTPKDQGSAVIVSALGEARDVEEATVKLDKNLLRSLALPGPKDMGATTDALSDMRKNEERSIKLDKSISASLDLPTPDDAGSDVIKYSLGSIGKQRSQLGLLAKQEQSESSSDSEGSTSSSFDEAIAGMTRGDDTARRHRRRRGDTHESVEQRRSRRHRHRQEAVSPSPNDGTPLSRSRRSRRRGGGSGTALDDSDVPPPPPLVSTPSLTSLGWSAASPTAFVTERQHGADVAVSAPANVTRNPDAIKAMLEQAGLDPNAILSKAAPVNRSVALLGSSSQRRASNAAPLPAMFATPITLPPPPGEIKPASSLSPIQAVAQGMSREQFVESKVKELEEREATIAKWEQYNAQCLLLINDYRTQLAARERVLLEREAAAGMGVSGGGGGNVGVGGGGGSAFSSSQPLPPPGSPSAMLASASKALSPRLTRSNNLVESTAVLSPRQAPKAGAASASTSMSDLLEAAVPPPPARPARPPITEPAAAAIVLQSVWRGRVARKEYKRTLHRTKVAREILSTERTYIGHLKLIKLLYMQPIEQRFGNKELLSRMEYSTVFQNIEYITRDAGSFWAKLEKRMKTWAVDCCIGDIFAEQELGAYQQYVNHFAQAQEVLAAHKRKKTAFDAYCRKCKDDVASSRLDLESLLILPVQRVPRYIMLLRDLLRHTPPTHPDYASLGLACERVAGVASTMNERKRDKDVLAELAALAERVRVEDLPGAGGPNAFQIVAEGRILREKYAVHEAVPTRDSALFWPTASEARTNDALELKKSGKDVRSLILFSDCLLICRGAPSDKRLVAELRLDLGNVWAAAPVDASGRCAQFVVIETVPDATRFPYARARHHTFTLGKKEAASESHCVDMIRRAVTAFRGTDTHRAQELLEQQVFSDDRRLRVDLFREALSISPAEAGDDLRALVGKALGAAAPESVPPFVFLVEAGAITAGVGSADAAAAQSTARPAAPPALTSSAPTASAAMLTMSPSPLRDGGARFFTTCGTLLGRDALGGLLSLAPRTVGAKLALEPLVYSFTTGDGAVAVQPRERLMQTIRGQPALGARLFRLVCVQLGHLLQHVPAPTSAEALAAAMADANLSRKGTLRGGGGGPSLVDPSAARLTQAEELRARFGLADGAGAATQLLKEFPCVLCEHMHVVGTLFVFNFYVCFGARFFDADVRRCVRMSDIDSTSATEPTSTIAGGLMIKLHDNSTILLDVGAAHRDVVLGMLRLYVAQAAAAEAIPAPRFARVALWRGADGSYSRLEDPASAEERPLQMSESDWERVYTHCAQTVHCKSLSVVVRQGVADPASFERCYSIGRGAVSLERTSEDGSGVTRFATLGTDATFNEMALVCPNMGSPSVNVVALEDTVLYAIDNVALQRELVEMRSEALADEAAMFELRLMRYIAGRLRDALVHGRRVCTMHPCHMTEM